MQVFHLKAYHQGVPSSLPDLKIAGPFPGYLHQCTEVRFASFLFRWIHYYGSNKSTGLEIGKSHLCAVHQVHQCIRLGSG